MASPVNSWVNNAAVDVAAKDLTSSPMDEYTKKLLADAVTQYPYLKAHNLVVNVGKGKGFAETYLPGEAGSPDEPRDPRVPLDRAGVTVFKPDQFHANDLAAEGLHLDPVSKMIRQRMLASVTPQQMQTIQSTGDYIESVKPKEQGGFAMSHDAALRNGLDSALRTAIFGQEGDATPEAMQYTPEQLGLLRTLHQYVTTGHQ